MLTAFAMICLVVLVARHRGYLPGMDDWTVRNTTYGLLIFGSLAIACFIVVAGRRIYLSAGRRRTRPRPPAG